MQKSALCALVVVWLIIQFREGLGQLRSLIKIDSGSNMAVR